MEQSNNELKKAIKLIFKVFFWISIFLLVPTIGNYILHWDIVQYARDLGILIFTMGLWYINRRIKKKEKEEE